MGTFDMANQVYIRFENPRALGIAKGVSIDIPENMEEDEAIQYLADLTYNEIIYHAGLECLKSIKYEFRKA